MSDTSTLYSGFERRRPDVLTEWQKKVEESLEENKFAIQENTGINRVIVSDLGVIRDDLAKHRMETKPVVDAMDKMETGVKVIGNIGDAGAWVVKKSLYLIAVVVFLKVLFSSGADAAVEAFWRVLGGGLHK